MPKMDIEDKEREIELELRSIKSMFEAGEIRRMYEIAKLYPTKIIRALRLNHGRYVEKLAKPEKFNITEIIRFSRLIGVDHTKVLDVILKEAVPNVIQLEEERKIKTPTKRLKGKVNIKGKISKIHKK